MFTGAQDLGPGGSGLRFPPAALEKEYALGFLKGILKGIYKGSIKEYTLNYSRIPNMI